MSKSNNSYWKKVGKSDREIDEVYGEMYEYAIRFITISSQVSSSKSVQKEKLAMKVGADPFGYQKWSLGNSLEI